MAKEKKAKKIKKEKKSKKLRQKGPQYCESLLKTQVLNYDEYYFTTREKLFYSAAAFLISAAVAYIMYGNIGCDDNGMPTTLTYFLDLIICGGAGIIAVKVFLPIREEQLCKKRKKVLRQQFMDMLDSLSSSIASGNNASKAFEAARYDLIMQYGDNSYIVDEVTLLLRGQDNFINQDEMLIDFGKRSGIPEIVNFAQVFAVSYRKGGDFGRVIRDTYDILYNKINIEHEIETKIAATKNEFNIMLVMPILIMVMMKFSGGDFSRSFGTLSGAAGVTVGLICVVAAILIARKITDIEV